MMPPQPALGSKGVAVALADGISSSSVSRVASELAVKGFLTDYYCTSDAWSVKTSAQRVIDATNSWLHSQTRRIARRRRRPRLCLHPERRGAEGADGAHLPCRRFAGLPRRRQRDGAAHRRPSRRAVVAADLSRPRARHEPAGRDRLPADPARGGRPLPAGDRRRLRASRRRRGGRRHRRQRERSRRRGQGDRRGGLSARQPGQPHRPARAGRCPAGRRCRRKPGDRSRPAAAAAARAAPGCSTATASCAPSMAAAAAMPISRSTARATRPWS